MPDQKKWTQRFISYIDKGNWNLQFTYKIYNIWKKNQQNINSRGLHQVVDCTKFLKGRFILSNDFQ